MFERVLRLLPGDPQAAADLRRLAPFAGLPAVR
jgi:hypothetical protein